jgi:anti-anti-sigma regulatory factor
MTLRIQRSVEQERVVFTLTGRIQAEQVPELLTLLRSEPMARGIVLDLEQVKLVDRDAVFFLALSETLGAKLRNCSAYIQKWIDQERIARQGGSEGPEESEG